MAEPAPVPIEGRGDREYAALRFAMDEEHPGCLSDPMFTADRPDVSSAELLRMRAVCGSCPLFTPCATYARVGRPKAGFWAGAHRDRLSQ